MGYRQQYQKTTQVKAASSTEESKWAGRYLMASPVSSRKVQVNLDWIITDQQAAATGIASTAW